MVHLWLTVPKDLAPDPPCTVPGGGTGSGLETPIEGISASGRGRRQESLGQEWPFYFKQDILVLLLQYSFGTLLEFPDCENHQNVLF